jgi:hypothetical protein
MVSGCRNCSEIAPIKLLRLPRRLCGVVADRPTGPFLDFIEKRHRFAFVTLLAWLFSPDDHLNLDSNDIPFDLIRSPKFRMTRPLSNNCF